MVTRKLRLERLEARQLLSAYTLDQQYGFEPAGGNEYLNWGGLNEKWVIASQGIPTHWAWIGPSGDVHAWQGGYLDGDPLLEQLTTAEYADTSLLYDAQPDEPPPPPPTENPHPDDPLKAAEHAAVLDLVPLTEATHTAVVSGLWSTPSTWGGSVPGVNSHVVVPTGITVTVDTGQADWIRVDGKLAFTTATDSTLTVDTIVVTTTGELENHSQAVSRIVFSAGQIDYQRDPFAFSRGLVSHGTLDIIGREVTPFIESGALAGATSVVAAADWRVGDELLIVGYERGQDELRVITGLPGGLATFDQPLTYAHGPHTSAGGTSVVQAPIVANLTRNIIFESESENVAERGHVMQMHSRAAHVEGAAFIRIGRSDKSRAATDPDGLGGGLDNPRGRYSLHFHRTGGLLHEDQPAVALGNVFRDSPGWALVNHSSFVDAIGNVSYDARGAHFAGEAGDEIGAFVRNLAVHSAGVPGTSLADDRNAEDFAFQGFGYWLQGSGGIALRDNISANQSAADYGIVSVPLEPFLVANLPDPSIWQGPNYWGDGYMTAGNVPLEFDGNVGWGSAISLNLWGSNSPHYHETKAVVSNSKFFSTVGLGYVENFVFENVAVIGSGYFGLSNAGFNGGMIYRNLHVEGFDIGVASPTLGVNEVIGGYFDTPIGWHIVNTDGNPRTLAFDGLQQFGPRTVVTYGYYLESFAWDIRYLLTPGYVPDSFWQYLFDSPAVYPVHALDVVTIGANYLSPTEFQDDFEWAPYLGLPEEIRTRTTGELREELGLWVGGRKLTGTFSEPQIRGVLHAAPPEFQP